MYPHIAYIASTHHARLLDWLARSDADLWLVRVRGSEDDEALWVSNLPTLDGNISQSFRAVSAIHDIWINFSPHWMNNINKNTYHFTPKWTISQLKQTMFMNSLKFHHMAEYFLHRHCLWCLWQISGMVSANTFTCRKNQIDWKHPCSLAQEFENQQKKCSQEAKMLPNSENLHPGKNIILNFRQAAKISGQIQNKMFLLKG